MISIALEIHYFAKRITTLLFYLIIHENSRFAQIVPKQDTIAHTYITQGLFKISFTGYFRRLIYEDVSHQKENQIRLFGSYVDKFRSELQPCHRCLIQTHP